MFAPFALYPLLAIRSFANPVTRTSAPPTTENTAACPSITLSVNFGGRFSRNEITPSFTSADAPRDIDAAAVDLVRLHRMVGAEHLPHHLPDQRAPRPAAVWSTISLRDRPRRRQQLVRRHHLLTRPPASASSAGNTRPE